jgi:hypothetical protein
MEVSYHHGIDAPDHSSFIGAPRLCPLAIPVGVDRLVSSVVIGFTSFGFAFYIASVAASVISFDCPFQTPLSLLIHHINHEVDCGCSGGGGGGTKNEDLKDTFKSALPQFMAPLDGLNTHVNQSFLSPIWKAGYNPRRPLHHPHARTVNR